MNLFSFVRLFFPINVMMGFHSFGGVLFLFASSVNVALVSTTCYNPDGSEQTSPAYQPCVQTVGTFSQCCGTNVRMTGSSILWFPYSEFHTFHFLFFKFIPQRHFHYRQMLTPNFPVDCYRSQNRGRQMRSQWPMPKQ
jgi:hypothetical protein